MNVATTIFLFVMFHLLADAAQSDTFDIQCSPDPETKKQIEEIKEKVDDTAEHIANTVEGNLVELKDIAQSVEEKVSLIDGKMNELKPISQTGTKAEKCENPMGSLGQTIKKDCSKMFCSKVGKAAVWQETFDSSACCSFQRFGFKIGENISTTMQDGSEVKMMCVRRFDGQADIVIKLDGGISSQINKIAAAVDELKQTDGTLSASLSSLKLDMAHRQRTDTTLNASLSSLNSDLSQLQQDMDQMKQTDTTLNASVSSLKVDMVQLKQTDTMPYTTDGLSWGGSPVYIGYIRSTSGVQTFDLPSGLPTSARMVRIIAFHRSGNEGKGREVLYRLWTEVAGEEHVHFLYGHRYPQLAISFQAPELWFPIGEFGRVVKASTESRQASNDHGVKLFVSGYKE